MDVDLMGRRSRLRFREGDGVIRYRGVIKQKSPDFRSPEIGISETCQITYYLNTSGCIKL